MWIEITFCVAWIIILALVSIYFHNASEKQSAILSMRIMRTVLDSIGIEYVKNKNSICCDDTLQKERECELKELAKTYNENFKKYGGSYDADRWLKMEE